MLPLPDPPVRMSVLPKGEDSKLNCSAGAGKSYYHKVGCPRCEKARQLKETMKFLRQAEREEWAAKGGEGSEAKKAKLMEVEVTPGSQAADEDMDPGHRHEDESPNKKQLVERTVSHVTGDSEVEVWRRMRRWRPTSSAMAPTGTRMTESSWSPPRSRR